MSRLSIMCRDVVGILKSSQDVALLTFILSFSFSWFIKQAFISS